MTDPKLRGNERLFFELYTQALRGPSPASALLPEVVHTWLEPLTALSLRHGVAPEQAPTHARLMLAVARGLLLDLVATGERSAIDLAFEHFVELCESGALIPGAVTAPSSAEGRPTPQLGRSRFDVAPRGELAHHVIGFDRSVGYDRLIGRSLAPVAHQAASSPSRDRILDAAEELFALRGFGGVGLAEVAERAGLGKASLFHHFPSKAQLYCAVMARVLATLDDALVRALAEGGDPTERLDRWVDTAVDVLAANRAYPRLLVRVLVEDDELPHGLAEGKEAADAVRRIGATAVRLLREGMAAGEFRRASAGHVLQTIIGAVVHPLATGRFGEELVGGPLFDHEQLARRKQAVKDLLHTGIVAEKETR